MRISSGMRIFYACQCRICPTFFADSKTLVNFAPHFAKILNKSIY